MHSNHACEAHSVSSAELYCPHTSPCTSYPLPGSPPPLPPPLQVKLNGVATLIGRVGLYVALLVFVVLMTRLLLSTSLSEWSFHHTVQVGQAPTQAQQAGTQAGRDVPSWVCIQGD